MNTKKISTSTNQPPNSPYQQPETKVQRAISGNRYRASNIEYPAPRPRPFIIPIFIPHAGCPHQCVFCNQVSITGAKQKMATPAELRLQIREFLTYKKENRKPVEVAFFGVNFLGLKSEEVKLLLESAAEFVRDGQVDGIRFSTRPDTINERSLNTIKDSLSRFDHRTFALLMPHSSKAEARLLCNRLELVLEEICNEVDCLQLKLPIGLADYVSGSNESEADFIARASANLQNAVESDT